MKVLILIFFLSEASYGATTQKKSLKKDIKVENKIYTVKVTGPEIVIGEKETSIKTDQNIKKKPNDLWYVGIVRTTLDYQLNSATSNILSFSPHLLGVVFGKKTDFPFFLYRGQYEIEGEWQRFKRESLFGNNIVFSQNLDLYQVNFFLNIISNWSRLDSFIFSAGLGIAPVYLTTNQSVFGNSSSELGHMGMLKGGIIYLINKKYELDIALRFGFGKVPPQSISTTSLVLGLNFE